MRNFCIVMLLFLSPHVTAEFPAEPLSNINSLFHKLITLPDCSDISIKPPMVTCLKIDTGRTMKRWWKYKISGNQAAFEDDTQDTLFTGHHVDLINDNIIRAHSGTWGLLGGTGNVNYKNDLIVNENESYIEFLPSGEVARLAFKEWKTILGIILRDNIIVSILKDTPAFSRLLKDDRITSILAKNSKYGAPIDTFIWDDGKSSTDIYRFVGRQNENVWLEVKILRGNNIVIYRIKTEYRLVSEQEILRSASDLPSCNFLSSRLDASYETPKRCVGALDISGEVYLGEFFDGSPDGLGTIFLKNGDYYSGEFSAGKITGQGTYIYFNGGIYSGSYVIEGDSPAPFIGKYEYPNGDQYIGSFSAKTPHGNGLFIHADGRVWSGYFSYGIRDLLGGEQFENVSLYRSEVIKVTKELQILLQDQHYLAGKVDGISGKDTAFAFGLFLNDWDSEIAGALGNLLEKRTALLNLRNGLLQPSQVSCDGIPEGMFGACFGLSE